MKEPLDTEVEHTIEEARMVLPGIQALFGFQLIATFNQRFAELPAFGRYFHLVALIFIFLSIGLIMTPAAYHRQAERGVASKRFVELASRLITIAMAPLAAALSLEVAVVAYLVTASVTASASLATPILVLLVWFWFIWPRSVRRRRRNSKKRVE